MKVFALGGAEDHVTEAALRETSLGLLPPGSILFVVRSGILAHTFPVAVTKIAATINQDLKALPPVSAIDPPYLAWYLRGVGRDIIRTCTKAGTTVSSVRTEALLAYDIPLAPLPEQRRIVAKIEELFSELDAGVAALGRVQAKLERYRASVLKAAVEGKLTEQWRKENPPEETGEELLQRILVERRRRWEEDQLAAFDAKGRKPPKDWREKYREPVGPDTTGLPELPEGWCWGSIDQLASLVRNGLSKKPSTHPPGVPILRISAVRAMRLDLSEQRYYTDPKVGGAFISDGDLLFTRYNGSIELLGVAALVRGLRSPMLHPDKLIRVEPVVGPPLPDFIEVAVHAGASRSHVVSRARTTAGQTGISGGDIRETPIPLPPIEEQRRLVRTVAIALDHVAVMQSQLVGATTRASAARQSILKRAFEGRLVPQDPNDEPASVLLDRIRAEREATKPKKKHAAKQPKAGKGSQDA